MIARLLSALVLSGSLGMALSLPLKTLTSLPSIHLPAAVERWLWNPRERTNAAISDYKKGDKESRRKAVGEADAALRLAPGDPRVQYDTGTIRLGAGNGKAAAEALALAAKANVPGLAGAASYNLGNASLATGDFDRAIAAYEQALRIDPKDKNAKWNLELAWRQRSDHQQTPGPSGGQGSQGGGGNASQSPGDDQQSQQPNKSSAADPGKSPQPAGGTPNPGNAQGQQGQPQPRPGDQPLPQFKNQPDMSAAEAAALLESVENLERQQRRAQAAQRAQRRAVKGRDW